MQLAFVDWLVIGVYGAVIISVGLWAGRRQQTSEGYFLAGRTLRWPFIGASIYAANISTEHLVGLAGSGYKMGLAWGAFEWIAVFCLVPLIVIFLPFYMRNRIYTVPEFLERRFSPGVRLTFSAFTVVLSVLVKISVSLWAASKMLNIVMGWDQLTVIWILGAVTAIYTMKGGLSAVVYTDSIQTLILIVAAIILTLIGLHHVGGISAVRAQVPPDFLSMVRPATDNDLPWPGVIIGVFFVGTFYFSMDQVLVQRVFAARDLNEGRLGATFCAWLKTLNPIILVGPGLIAYVLYHNNPQVIIANPDDAYPTLLKNLMPPGLLGLTIAGMTAALMGHLSATYNSIGTLIAQDFFLKIRPQASHKSQILVGRIAIASVFVLGALWAPVIAKSEYMFKYIQVISSYMMMPFALLFFVAVYWKRANTPGAVACMIAIFTVCPIMLLNNDCNYRILPFMNTPLLRPWLHGAMVASVICVAVMVMVSLLTAPPRPEQLKNTTVQGLEAEGGLEVQHVSVALYKDYRLWLSLVCAGTAIAWYIMR